MTPMRWSIADISDAELAEIRSAGPRGGYVVIPPSSKMMARAQPWAFFWLGAEADPA